MNVRRFTSLVLLAAVFAALFALPSLAADDDEAGSTEAGVTSDSGLAPAVPIPEEPESVSVADWTYRYLIPATLLLVVVVIALTSIRYFTNVVRNRYRTVEE